LRARGKMRHEPRLSFVVIIVASAWDMLREHVRLRQRRIASGNLIIAEHFVGHVAVHRVGAEARLDSAVWLSRDVVFKQRVVKGYRHPVLDRSLQTFRMKNEVRLMLEARKAGIAVPVIYSVGLGENRIVMEEIKGVRVKDALEGLPKDKAEEVCRKIGEIAARLHANDIVHGDLTTSNMLLEGDRIVVIDFSLGSKSSELEDKGVDMHLLEEAFHSAHYRRSELYETIKDSYVKAYPGGAEVLRKVKEIEKRGRYTRKE